MMFEGHLLRVVAINFISALIISFVACYFLKTLHLSWAMHIADLFGLFFLAVFGISILVESGDVRNNHQRFVLAIALIVVFDMIFLIIVPLLFGNVFSALTYGINSVFIYLAIYAVIILLSNFALYMRDRKYYD